MRLNILNVCLVLALAAKVYATGTLLNEDAFNVSGPDWRQSNNYLLYNCGTNLIPVTIALSQIIYLLGSATSASSISSASYKAFFKTATPTTVTDVLTKIEQGSNVPLGTGDRQHRPTLVCIDDQESGLAHLWEYCQNNPRATAIHMLQSPFVILCPSFQNLTLGPRLNQCPTVNAANTQLNDESDTSANQYGALVRALAHMYIPTLQPQRKLLDHLLTGVNDCLELSAQQAVSNPSNYAFYVTYLRAECTDFPTQVTRGVHRGLLEGAGSGDADDFVMQNANQSESRGSNITSRAQVESIA